MALGITLLVAGTVVVLLSFAFAAKNMVSAAKNPGSMLSTAADNPFSKHIGAIVVMACGGGSALIGIILIIVALVSKHAS